MKDERISCPYCGWGHYDNRFIADETRHMVHCTWRTPWRAFLWKWFGKRFT